MDGLTAVYLGVLLVSVLLLIASLISGIGHDSDFSHEIAHDHERMHRVARFGADRVWAIQHDGLQADRKDGL